MNDAKLISHIMIYVLSIPCVTYGTYLMIKLVILEIMDQSFKNNKVIFNQFTDKPLEVKTHKRLIYMGKWKTNIGFNLPNSKEYCYLSLSKAYIIYKKYKNNHNMFFTKIREHELPVDNNSYHII